jgi:hypothetical protein
MFLSRPEMEIDGNTIEANSTHPSIHPDNTRAAGQLTAAASPFPLEERQNLQVALLRQ